MTLAGDLAPVFAGAVLAQLSPGPNSVATANTALGSGRSAGLCVAGGVATGALLWALLFSLGLGALLGRSPGVLRMLEVVGGLYLLRLGWKTWADRPDPTTAARRRTLPAAYLRGLTVVMTNPKAAAMWIAISTYVAALGLSHAQVALVGSGVAASALVVYGGYALVFSTRRATAIYLRHAGAVQRVLGIGFGLIGAGLLLRAAAGLP